MWNTFIDFTLSRIVSINFRDINNSCFVVSICLCYFWVEVISAGHYYRQRSAEKFTLKTNSAQPLTRDIYLTSYTLVKCVNGWANRFRSCKQQFLLSTLCGKHYIRLRIKWKHTFQIESDLLLFNQYFGVKVFWA